MCVNCMVYVVIGGVQMCSIVLLTEPHTAKSCYKDTTNFSNNQTNLPY